MKLVKILALSLALGSSLLAAEPFHTSILKGLEKDLITADVSAANADRITGKKYLFIYFSAHWCPPCRAFTPKLVDFYKTHVKNGDFELLFISSDKTKGAMAEYMKSTDMPWVAAKLRNKKAEELKKQYGVKGIPALVLLDENDQVVASSWDGENYKGPNEPVAAYLHRK